MFMNATKCTFCPVMALRGLSSESLDKEDRRRWRLLLDFFERDREGDRDLDRDRDRWRFCLRRFLSLERPN